MNTQDRAVVKALLQYMTERYLTGSEEFRAALKHFNITTTAIGQKFTDESAALFADKPNHFVDVFSPDTIDSYPHGLRATSSNKAEAEAYAADARARGDEPVNARVLNARAYLAETLVMSIEVAHAEALEMDAEFNFERISREINGCDEPDAITVTEAQDLFVDRYAVLDAAAVGKRYIVAFPDFDGKLIKHGTYFTRSGAINGLLGLPTTRGIERGQLVVLKAL